MLKEKESPVIILTATEWHDNPVSTMHIAACLSQTRTVIFVETPGRRIPKITELDRIYRRIKRFFQGPTIGHTKERGLDPKSVIIFSPFAIPLPKYRLIRALNHLLLTWQLKKVFKKLQIKNPILWAFSPYWLEVITSLSYKKLVFHCVDALETYDDSLYFKMAYEALAKKADVVFTPGILIFEALRKFNNNTHLIGHGCSDAHLNYVRPDLQIPALKNIPRPIAVYAGCLANWVDYDLLDYLAKRLPQISFVLLGYVHALAPQEKIATLLQHPNVFSLGYIDYAMLPAFYHAATVGIIPYQSDNPHIYYCTPTKILDYFAAALPCVSTRYPAAQSLQDLITVADDPESFALGLLNALDASSEKKLALHAHAQMHSWPAQVKKMLVALGEI
jgi:hypothetical protein